MTTQNPSPVKNDAAEKTLKSVEASLMEALSLDETVDPTKPAPIPEAVAETIREEPSSATEGSEPAVGTPVSAATELASQLSEGSNSAAPVDRTDVLPAANTADLSDLGREAASASPKQEFTLDLPPVEPAKEAVALDPSTDNADRSLAEAALDRLAQSDSDRNSEKSDSKLQSLEQSMLAEGMSRAELDAILSEEVPQPSSAPAVSAVRAAEGKAKPASEKTDSAKSASRSFTALMKQTWKIQVASAASLAVGFVASAIYNKPVIEVPIDPPVPPAVLYASLNVHRNEPIQSIVPFDGLDEEVIKLGAKLFHDSGLSANGKTSCASCHTVPGSGADNNAFSIGITEKTHRNTLSVLNSATNIAFNWDGEFEKLEDQLATHVVQPWTLSSDWGRITKLLQANKLYDTSFKLYLRGEPTESRAQEALATYIRSLSTVGSNFDAWLQGEEQALSSDAIAGYHLFKKFNCVSCHQGSNVGGTMFQSISKLKPVWPRNEQSAHGEKDTGRELVTKVARDHDFFRVPSLRTAMRTAPYMHDGSVATLKQAIEIMLEGYVGVKPNPVDVERLAAFIESLNGDLGSQAQHAQQLEKWKARRAAESSDNSDLAQLDPTQQDKNK